MVLEGKYRSDTWNFVHEYEVGGEQGLKLKK